MDLKKALKKITFYCPGESEPTSFLPGDVLHYERATGRFTVTRGTALLLCEVGTEQHTYFTLDELEVPEYVAADLSELSKLSVHVRTPKCPRKPAWDFKPR